MIETVLGAIPPSSLGITMCHEHIALNLKCVRGDDDSVFDNRSLISAELAQLYAQGCRTVIEVSGNDMGRDVAALRQYACDTGLHIVASSGFYLEPYHTPWLHHATATEVAALFIHELTVGIGDTGIRTGLIAEIATGCGGIRPTEEKVFLAAAQAAVATGCAISTHCDMGRMGREQAELLLSNGVSPQQIILGHTDLSDDCNYHLALLDRGVTLAFDTIGKTKYISDKHRADNLALLIQRGYESQLLLSQDVSRCSYFKANGGAGYTAVLGYFLPMLRERGVSDTQLERLLVANPARLLDR